MEELRSLVVRAQGGDLEAYGEIVRRFQDMAYGYAYSVLGDFHLAEDAAQEAFIEAYRCLAALREPAAFAGWFRRIVYKHCDRIIRRRPLEQAPLGAAAVALSHEPRPPEVAERREMRDTVLRAIRALPEQERTVTTLFYINGYSQKEIADFLEVPVTTVKGRLHTSRKRLKERMTSMVAGTLRADAPNPDEVSDRVSFLLRAAERMAQGIPLFRILDELAKEARTARVRDAIEDLNAALKKGKTVSQALGDQQDLFPPMVVWLVEIGEGLGQLDVTMRMAGEWLHRGEYEVDPYAFAEARFYRLRQAVKKAMADGATALVIDTRRTEPLPRTKTRPEVVWLEREMPDGSREKVVHLGGSQWMPSYLGELRMLTILEEHQEGDAITGKLRIRLEPQDAEEVLLPISYRPFRDGEEVRIRLSVEERAEMRSL